MPRKSEESRGGSWESQAQVFARIRKAMRVWIAMDQTARRLGRGLGRREIIARVAVESGVTASVVAEACKGEAFSWA